jgi:hypothetical protein
MILIDSAPIRNRIRAEYEKVRRDLDNARRNLERFNNHDKPKFMAWVSKEFGALLTQMRELSQKLAEKRELIFQVETESLFGNLSPRKAYQRIKEWMEEANLPEDPFAGAPPNSKHSKKEDRPEPDPFSQQADSDSKHEDERFEEAFEDFFFGGRGRRQLARQAAKEPAGRVKELYRALVRLLHPDKNRDMTAQKLEWWHQAQKAYADGNAEELEVILSLCEIEESGTTSFTSASVLIRITKQFARALRQVRKQLSTCRADPGWEFSKRRDLELLYRQVRHEMSHDINMLRCELQDLEALIASWEGPAPKRPRRRSPRRSEEDDCPF